MRKRLIIILLLLSVFSTDSLFAGLVEKRTNLCDSLKNVLMSMPLDTNKIKTAYKFYNEYSNYKWAIELLNIAYEEAGKLKRRDMQLDYLMHMVNFNMGLNNFNAAKSKLKILKYLSYKTKSFNNYFFALGAILQKKVEEGEYEYALVNAREMEQEAIRLNNHVGIIQGKLVMANYYLAQDNKREAIALYKEISQSTNASHDDKLMSLLFVYYIANEMGDYNMALNYLNASKIEVNKYILVNKMTSRSQNAFDLLLIEIYYCDLYANMRDAEGMRSHIDSMDVYYYSDNTSNNFYGEYHGEKAKYYALIKRLPESLKEVDKAILFFNKTDDPENIIIFTLDKISYLKEQGYMDKATHLYDKLIKIKSDFYKKSMDKRHKETLKNYEFEQSKLKGEKIERWSHLFLILSLVSIIIMIVYYILKSYSTERKIKKVQKALQHEYEIADNANKMKESFVKNISGEINLPLLKVVNLSKELVHNSDLSAEVKNNYSLQIKENARILTEIINNVLDLSRLESRVNLLDIQSYSLEDLLKETSFPYTISGSSKGIMLHIDKIRFINMMNSLFDKNASTITVTSLSAVEQREEKKEITITISASPLARQNIQQEIKIINDINELLMSRFSGAYTLDPVSGSAILRWVLNNHSHLVV